jgi:hypothetical protein
VSMPRDPQSQIRLASVPSSSTPTVRVIAASDCLLSPSGQCTFPELHRLETRLGDFVTLPEPTSVPLKGSSFLVVS